MTATADVTVTGLTTPQNVRTVQRYDFLFPLVGNWSALLYMSGNDVLPDGAVNIQLGVRSRKDDTWALVFRSTSKTSL